MRYVLILLASLVLCALPSRAQADQVATIGHDRYEEPGFVALAFVISDSTFFERWERPETPRIQPDTRYARGETAYPILIFQTDTLDESGHVDLTFDIAVTRPDGTSYPGTPVTELIAWQGAPPPGLVLARSKVSLVFEAQDQLGLYTVDIMLHDMGRNKSFPLSLSFEVTE